MVLLVPAKKGKSGKHATFSGLGEARETEDLQTVEICRVRDVVWPPKPVSVKTAKKTQELCRIETTSFSTSASLIPSALPVAPNDRCVERKVQVEIEQLQAGQCYSVKRIGNSGTLRTADRKRRFPLFHEDPNDSLVAEKWISNNDALSGTCTLAKLSYIV